MFDVLCILFPLLCGAAIGLIIITAPRRPEPESLSYKEVMSRLEALNLLGVSRETDISAIRMAHRKLMRRYHPDRGGTHEKAATINVARDILLKRN